MLIPVNTVPGICKDMSAYAAGKPFSYTGGRLATGRFIDGDKVRFVAGFPEKIGGWVGLGLTPMVGVPRAMREWRDNAANPQMGIGTESHLYRYDGVDIFDITPQRTIVTGNLSNPFIMTNGSPTILVADTAQHLANGDWVFLSAPAVLGGLTINGWYPVSAVSSTGYEITAPLPATSSASGGGQVAFQYPRKTLTDPFATTSGSATVRVTAVGHGATTGDYVNFSGSNSVGGVSPNGEFQVTVLDQNTFTIVTSTAATSTATDGGVVSVAYDVSIASGAIQGGQGYGQGLYGAGPYGVDPGATTTQNACWTLWPYGNQLLACALGGTIYVFDPIFGGRAHALLNAPTNVLALLVTPERFVVALGTAVSGMQIAWADQNDYTNWTTAIGNNTANSGRTLVGGAYLVGGSPVRAGVSLILSNRAAFALSYTGDQEIYQSPMIGDNAGLIAPNAIVTMGGVTYWMGDRDFWMYDGSASALPTDDIRDFVFGNLNRVVASKSFAGTNRAKREVFFFYPSRQSTEVDSYAIFHADQGCFSIGKLARPAWCDADLFLAPLACDPSGNLYQHETGTDADGQPLESFITLAPVDISNGNQNLNFFGVIPDFQRLSGSADLTVNTRYYPQDPDNADGPHTITATDTTPRVDLRGDGKMVGFQIDSNVLGGDFRLGVFRIDAQPSGNRA